MAVCRETGQFCAFHRRNSALVISLGNDFKGKASIVCHSAVIVLTLRDLVFDVAPIWRRNGILPLFRSKMGTKAT